MKIIISKSDKYRILYIIILLIGIVPNVIESNIGLTNITRVCGVFFFVLCALFGYGKIEGTFKKLIYYFFVLELVEIVVSTYRYKQSIVVTLILASSELAILGYFFLIKEWNENSLCFFKNFLVKYTIFMSLYVMIQYWIFQYFEIICFIPFNGNQGRIGVSRLLYGGMLLFYGTVVSYGEVFRAINQYGFDWKIHSGDGIYYLASGIGTIYLVVYNQTRGALIPLVAVFCVMLIMALKSVRSKVIGIAILMIMVIAIPQLPIVEKYVSFSQEETYSTDTRFEEIEFFVEQAMERPLIGTGIIYSDNSEYRWLLNGKGGRFFRSDVGVFGFFHQYGIVGCVWLILVFIKMWNVVQKSKKTGQMYEVRMAVFLYLIMSSLTLLLISADNMLYFVLLLVLFEDRYCSETLATKEK